MSFRPGSIDYDGDMSRHYDSARSLTDASLATWRSALTPYVQGQARVLDVGAGTGRFSVPLAEWSGGLVVGVEPAEGMRRQAAGLPHPRVHFVAGRAEELPLPDSTFGAALLSHVFHHVADRVACARELFRVLEPGGHVLLRGALADRLDGITLFEHFPEARAVCERFPTLTEATSVLESAGLTIGRVERVEQETCATLVELARRTALRADTTLALLPDEVFLARQAALEVAAQAELEPTPVQDRLDLIVARRAG